MHMHQSDYLPSPVRYILACQGYSISQTVYRSQVVVVCERKHSLKARISSLCSVFTQRRPQHDLTGPAPRGERCGGGRSRGGGVGGFVAEDFSGSGSPSQNLRRQAGKNAKARRKFSSFSSSSLLPGPRVTRMLMMRSG